MTSFAKLTMWVAIGTNLCVLGFVVQMGGILQLPIMLLVLVYPILGLAALVKAGMSWRKQQWPVLLPVGILAAGLVAVLPSGWLGHKICDAIFWHNLPKYRQVVERVQFGEILVTNRIQRLDLPRSQRPRCYLVFATREPDGETSVEFLIGGGFPVKHTGYMYYSGDKVEKGSDVRSRWPRGTKMTDHWYQIGD